MFKKKKNLSKDTNYYSNERELIRLELIKTKLALDAAYSVLQNVTEPDLIDSAIYELKSVQMKYSFLHKKIRELSQKYA